MNKIPNEELLEYGDTPQEQALGIIEAALDADEEIDLRQALQQALELDPDCAEAYLLLAEETAESLPEARELYQQAVAAARRMLGEDYFTDPEYVGHFWEIEETQTYMAAADALASVLWQMDERAAAIAQAEDLLRLNPADDQGIHYVLQAWLLADGQLEAASIMDARFAHDTAACWAYLHALYCWRQTGASAEAHQALRDACKANRYAALYLTGARPLPPDMPEEAEAGDEDEGAMIVLETGVAWIESPDAIIWLADELTDVLRPGD